MGLEGHLDLVVLELVELQGEEQALGPDLRGPGAEVTLELGPGRIVLGHRTGQARIGAHGPQPVHGALIEPDPVVQQLAQVQRVTAQLHEPALQLHQLVIGGLGRRQIDLDLRVVAPGIEVGELPLGQGVKFHGRVHGEGLARRLRRD